MSTTFGLAARTPHAPEDLPLCAVEASLDELLSLASLTLHVTLPVEPLPAYELAYLSTAQRYRHTL
jgi:hypothetical protein